MSNVLEFTGTVHEKPSLCFNSQNRKSYLFIIKVGESKYIPISIYKDALIYELDTDSDKFKVGDELSVKGELFIFNSKRLGRETEFSGRLIVHNDKSHYIKFNNELVTTVMPIKQDNTRMAVSF